jgi:hypothetical protein
MYSIQMNEVSEEFARCWNAAGLHLESQAQGPIQSWLRAHLNPPFLEHLSFRLGNQLFYIRLEDVNGRLDVPGSLEGLLQVAVGCAGHACVMPMKKVGKNWEPVEAGWGLLDALTRDAIYPPSLITDRNIEMTDWELQDLAVQVVRDRLQRQGRELMSWNSNPEVNPSLWFIGDSGEEWVLVRAVRGPKVRANLPDNFPEIFAHFNELGHKGYFASVGIMSVDGLLDTSTTGFRKRNPVYRGHQMHIEYEGLQALSS